MEETNKLIGIIAIPKQERIGTMASQGQLLNGESTFSMIIIGMACRFLKESQKGFSKFSLSGIHFYPETFSIFRGNGPLYQVDLKDRDMILLQYGTKPLEDEIEYTGPIMGKPDQPIIEKKIEENEKVAHYVRSGMVRNEQTIIGQGTIFNVPVGKGRVLAFTFDPLHRFMNHHDAPLVWNALINWDHLGD